MAAFTCQICFEEKCERLKLAQLRTGNGDVLRHADCGHPVCQECLAAHVRVRVEEQRVYNLRCPSFGCQAELFEQDLQRLSAAGALAHEVCERFAALRARDFGARARSLEETTLQTQEEVELLLSLHDMRRCPCCQLVLQKSSGCNSFYCICGEHFNYALAERAVGHGVKHFKWVLQLAKSQALSIREATSFGGDLSLFKRVQKTSEQLAISRAEAWELLRQAQDGDEDARNRIRAGRGRGPRQPEERRVADDGVAYTREQFLRHYGGADGQWWWDACAERALRPAEPRCMGEGMPAGSCAYLVPLTLAPGVAPAWVPLGLLAGGALEGLAVTCLGPASRRVRRAGRDRHRAAPDSSGPRKRACVGRRLRRGQLGRWGP